jgi:hypothetical protein
MHSFSPAHDAAQWERVMRNQVFFHLSGCCIVAAFAPKRELPACGGRGPIETLFGGLHQIDGCIALHLSEHSIEGPALAER